MNSVARLCSSWALLQVAFNAWRSVFRAVTASCWTSRLVCVGEVLGAGVEPFSDVEQGEDLVFADGEQALAEALNDDGPVGVDGFDKALAVLGDLGEPLLCVGDLLVVHGFLLLGGLELVAQRVELGVELV